MTVVRRTKGLRKNGLATAAGVPEALLAEIVASSQDAIFSRSLTGTITTWNRAAECIFGYTAAEIVGRSGRILLPTGRLEEQAGLLRKIRQGERIEQFETARRRKDGGTVWLSLSVFPIRNRKGNVVGSATIARDITVQHELEAAFNDATEQERRRLGQELHDGLGQQLGGIELLCESFARSLRERQLPEASTARFVTRQVRLALRQVRSLARGLTPVLDDPAGLMLALGDLSRMTQALPGIRCSFECEQPVLVRNHTTAVHLFRITQEAIANALRHGKARRIALSLSEKGDHILLEICDNGRGLPDRGAVCTSGIGTKIMAYRAEAMGGTVAIERLRPRGVKVVCEVPSEPNGLSQ